MVSTVHLSKSGLTKEDEAAITVRSEAGKYFILTILKNERFANWVADFGSKLGDRYINPDLTTWTHEEKV